MKFADVVWESNLPAEIQAKFDAQWIQIATIADFDNLNEIEQDYIVQWFEHTINNGLGHLVKPMAAAE